MADYWVQKTPRELARSDSLRSWQIVMKPAVNRAGLGSGIGWDTFRHTYSTILRQLGIDLKVQEELLRHADIRTTMNIYTQAVSAEKRSAHSKVVRMVASQDLNWTVLDSNVLQLADSKHGNGGRCRIRTYLLTLLKGLSRHGWHRKSFTGSLRNNYWTQIGLRTDPGQVLGRLWQ
ncbi:MAG: tyrosine-type recombinase/integrase [Terriglobales bacterium]